MKKYHVIITKTAKEDLRGIARYIAKDNPVRAISFIRELTESLEDVLSIFPLGGTSYPDVEEDIRSRPYAHYISFYKVKEQQKQVEILHIFSARRNISELIKRL